MRERERELSFSLAGYFNSLAGWMPNKDELECADDAAAANDNVNAKDRHRNSASREPRAESRGADSMVYRISPRCRSTMCPRRLNEDEKKIIKITR